MLCWSEIPLRLQLAGKPLKHKATHMRASTSTGSNLILSPCVEIFKRGRKNIVLNPSNGHWLCVSNTGLEMLKRFSQPQNSRENMTEWGIGQEKRTASLISDAKKREILVSIKRNSKISQKSSGNIRGGFHKLRNLSWNIARDCNLSCKHCYLSWDHRHGTALSKAECLDLVSKFPEVLLKKSLITISGGEPFTVKHLFEVLREIKTLGFSFAILTNGTLVDPAKAEILAKIKPDHVQVSLDGASPNTNDFARGRGSFQKSIAGIRCLLNFGIRICVSMTITRANLTDIWPMVDLAESLGVKDLHFPYFVQRGRGFENRELLSLSEDQKIKCLDTIRAVHSSGRVRVGYIELRRKSFLSPVQPEHNCGLGRQIALIESDGSVYPCPSLDFPELCIGNIRAHQLKEIVAESRILAKLGKINRRFHNPKCRRCSFRVSCNGGCIGRGYALRKNPLDSDPYCSLMRRDYLEALWSAAEANSN